MDGSNGANGNGHHPGNGHSVPPPVPLAITWDVDPPPPPPKPARLRPKQRAYLEALSHGLTRSGAAKAAKISRQTFYNWLNAVDDEGVPTAEALLFKAELEAAHEVGTHSMIDEAKRRAVNGWLEPVFSVRTGQRVGTVRRYDSKLLQFLIMQRDASFRQRHEIVGANGAPLHPDKVEHTYKLDLSLLSDDELSQYRATVESQRDLLAKLEARGGSGARQN